MIHKRRVGENIEDYKLRLYTNKVMYGLTNKEIGSILNEETGNDWDESAYRKPIEAALKYADRLKEQWFAEGYNKASAEEFDDSLLDEYYEKERMLYKREQILRDKKREIRKLWRTEGRADNLKQVILDYADTVNEMRPVQPVDPNKIQELMEQERENVAVLQLSDWHFGEVIENFLGSYNKEVFDKSIEGIILETIKYCNIFNVKTLKVLNMGDLMSGMIHVSTRVANEEDVVEQTLYVAEKLVEMLNAFSHEIPYVELHSTVDNHGRINKKYTDHIEKESFALFVPAIVKSRVAGLPNVEVVDNTINGVREYDIGVIDIFDRQAIFTHGHNDRINENAIKDLILMSRINRPICVFMGHYHKNYEDEIHGIDIIVNPPLVKTGDYAKSIRKSSQARQKLTLFTQEDGEVLRIGTFYITP